MKFPHRYVPKLFLDYKVNSWSCPAGVTQFQRMAFERVALEHFTSHFANLTGVFMLLFHEVPIITLL